MPRFLHRLYAHLFRYFWLPCPMCMEPFGGHQRPAASVKTPDCGVDTYKGVCPRCSVIVRRYCDGMFTMISWLDLDVSNRRKGGDDTDG